MSTSSADRDPLEVLAEDFVERFRAGEHPSLTEYARRLPEREAQLMSTAKTVYMQAVRDWAANGAASQHVLDAAAMSRQLRKPNDDIALAHAHFRLGGHLLRSGQDAAARHHFDEARRLHPESWNIWRQTHSRNELGFASGPEFWARVDALGERRYYEKVDIEGMP